tara:strand:+ start:34607 stop:35554 length:948 start_codon:yes stop_codon:yes gene_type:complete
MAFKIIEFNYPKPDEYLGQFDNEQLEGTHTYDGPEDIWVFIDKETKKLAPTAYMDYDEGLEFNPAPHLEKVYVDCEQNPIICSLMECDFEDEMLEQVEETLPNGSKYLTYKNPPPEHTYEKFDIEYDFDAKTWKKVASSIEGGIAHYPWKQPHVKWTHVRKHRNSLLAGTDHKVKSDMPADTKASWETFRTTLRDLPVEYGDSFNAEITTAGTGYSVDDELSFAKADLENNITADAMKVTVKTIGSSGEITGISISSNQAINDGNDIVVGREAKEYADATYTTSSGGTGAKFKISKCQRYAAWKVLYPTSPCGTI